jgi:hypothetical protein
LGTCQIFFGDVSFIFGRGAALLVDAASETFRNSMAGERMPSLRTRIPSFFDSSVFEAAQPGDTIYALLAISKETTTRNLLNDSDTKELTKEERFALKLAPKEGFANKAYKVDYRLSVIDVYPESNEFSIRKADKKRALDILVVLWR